ncbi:Serine/threonine-protein kinase CDG1 [Raphanus sativus]|nr:Serine/threonine-protein kinase CDG1 [Raphanus sativus]
MVSSDPEALLPPNRAIENFKYLQLANATNNFSLDSRIGQGGFGDVYKGKLEINGQDVAIKMLDPSGKQGTKEFLAEVLMLSIFRNKNLVKLCGYCCQGDQRSIVYEYMPLGSVEDQIHNFKSVQEALDLSTRMKIALGTAKGLAYLHDEAQVIYRDMKTANILLDHEFEPKLSDFGLAKLGPGEGMSHVTTRVMGTLGYCAPEYAATGKLTMKSDIYSFGVVLLELITGRKPFGDSTMGAQRLLVQWALPYYRNLNIRQITDPKLLIQGHPYLEEAARRAVQLAYMCLRENAKARPTIREVVKALEVIVGDIVRKHKGKNIQYKRGVDKGKKIEGSTVSEEDEDLERQRDLADAKRWAKGLRNEKRKRATSYQT